MITFSRDFVLQSDWYSLWKVAEVDSFCSGCCQALLLPHLQRSEPGTEAIIDHFPLMSLPVH